MTTMDTAFDRMAPKLSPGRLFNFSAGPGTLPESVLRRAQEDIWDIFGTGMGILEHSHRGKAYDRVLAEAIADCRRLANIPDDYEVLFAQGGATTQCWMVPANLLPDGRTADYFNTGKWASDAIEEVHHYGKVHVAGSSKETRYDHIPTPEETKHSEDPAYVHFCWNNTIAGTEWQRLPDTPGKSFLVSDASSNIFSRPLDVTKLGLIYAGAQKNLGPAGTVLIIARKDVIEKPVRDLPKMQRYDVLAQNESRYNTPPTFGIYLIGQMLKWKLSWESAPGKGDALANIERYNREKAKIIYDAIDASDFYIGAARPSDRSLMNVTFRTPSEELDKLFVKQAEKEGLDGLKGHRMVGGMRASIYNSFPREGCEALAQFMREFERKNG